jgi:hypothetical protein
VSDQLFENPRPCVSRADTVIRLAERIAATIAASIRRSAAQASPPPPVSTKLSRPILSVIRASGASLRDRRKCTCPRTFRFGQVPIAA